MSNDKLPLLVGFGVGLLLGMLIAGVYGEYHFERAAIDHGYAEYNSTNGNWQWKEPK